MPDLVANSPGGLHQVGLYNLLRWVTQYFILVFIGCEKPYISQCCLMMLSGNHGTEANHESLL